MPEPFRGQVKNFLGMIVLIARLRASAASSGRRREAEGHRTSFSMHYSVLSDHSPFRVVSGVR